MSIVAQSIIVKKEKKIGNNPMPSKGEEINCVIVKQWRSPHKQPRTISTYNKLAGSP